MRLKLTIDILIIPDCSLFTNVPCIPLLNMACFERKILFTAVCSHERTWFGVTRLLDAGFCERKYFHNEFEEGALVDSCFRIDSRQS